MPRGARPCQATGEGGREGGGRNRRRSTTQEGKEHKGSVCLLIVHEGREARLGEGLGFLGAAKGVVGCMEGEGHEGGMYRERGNAEAGQGRLMHTNPHHHTNTGVA